jgi:hypothetical protein
MERHLRSGFVRILKLSIEGLGQIYSIYKQTKAVPNLGSNVGRLAKKIPVEWEKEYGKQRLNEVYLEKAICMEQKIRMPHNTIHEIMLKKGALLGSRRPKRNVENRGLGISGSILCQLYTWMAHQQSRSRKASRRSFR